MRSTRLTSRFFSLWVVCLLLAAPMVAQQGPQLPDPGRTSLTREQQIQLGFQAASEVYKQMPVLADNSPETQYVRQIGQRLASAIPQQYSWPFEFHTIAQKDVNAFALPGGPMFVNVGAITTAGSEAELAGVMAHEMAHVYMQHSAKMMRQNTVPSIISGLGQVLGSMIGGVGGAAASIGGQLGGGMLSMKFSRADESQADAVGAMIMYRAGYDPRALARFFERLEQEAGGRGPQFLSDHPNPGNRQEAILNEADRWPPKQWRANPAEFSRMQQTARQRRTYSAQEIADGAKSGRWVTVNRQNGAIFKAPPGVKIQQTSAPGGDSSGAQQAGPVSWRDVAPGQLVNSNLGPLSIARPENWDVLQSQQQGGGITIAPRAGVVGNGIGYGVVINGVQSQNGGSLDEITSQIAESLQNGSGLRQISNAQSINVGGVRGRSVMMESNSPFPTSSGNSQKERDWLVTAPQQNGGAIFFVFVAPQSEFERLRPMFDEMLRSAQF